MRSEFRFLRFAVVATVLFSFVSVSAQAGTLLGYMGPGAGLSMLGALAAVLCVFVLAILGPILYPLRAFLAWRRRRAV